MVSRFAGERLSPMVPVDRGSYGAQIQGNAGGFEGGGAGTMRRFESQRQRSTLADDVYSVNLNQRRQQRAFEDAKNDLEEDERLGLQSIRSGGGFGSAFAQPLVGLGSDLLGGFLSRVSPFSSGSVGFGSAAGRRV